MHGHRIFVRRIQRDFTIGLRGRAAYGRTGNFFGNRRIQTTSLGCQLLLLFDPQAFCVRKLDDLVTLLSRQPSQLRKLVRLNHRQVVEREKALNHETLDQLRCHLRNNTERFDRNIQLLVERLLSQYVNIPADQF